MGGVKGDWRECRCKWWCFSPVSLYLTPAPPSFDDVLLCLPQMFNQLVFLRKYKWLVINFENQLVINFGSRKVKIFVYDTNHINIWLTKMGRNWCHLKKSMGFTAEKNWKVTPIYEAGNNVRLSLGINKWSTEWSWEIISLTQAMVGMHFLLLSCRRISESC